MTIFTMLAHPNRFFNEFEKLPSKWVFPYTGYYLVSFEVMLVSLLSNEKFSALNISVFFVLLISLLVAFIGALIYRLEFGTIWLFLGSKIFGGRALCKELGDAVGYILFPFGIIGFIIVPVALIPAWIGDQTIIAISMLCVIVPVLLLISLGFLIYSGFAVRQLNGFGWLKTIGVIIWYPFAMLLLMVILLIIY